MTRRCAEELVFLTMPATTLQNIEDLIDPEIKEKIQSQGVSFNEIIQSAYENELRPQSLLQVVSNDKEIHIFLN